VGEQLSSFLVETSHHHAFPVGALLAFGMVVLYSAATRYGGHYMVVQTAAAGSDSSSARWSPHGTTGI
jgi:hypothetical protein